MSGVTVPLAFPYPTGGDLVQGVDNAIQALAESVDDYLAARAQDLSGVDSVVVTAGANVTLANTRVFRRGRIGMLNVQALVSTALLPVSNTLLTLPVGYRPVVNWRGLLVVYVAGGNTTILVEVQTTGVVQIANAIPNAATVFGSVDFPLAL